MLGWRLNTRLLEISLPDDKYRAWSADVQEGESQIRTLPVEGVGDARRQAQPHRLHYPQLPSLHESESDEGLEGQRCWREEATKDGGAEALEDLAPVGRDSSDHANRGVSMNLLVTQGTRQDLLVRCLSFRDSEDIASSRVENVATAHPAD